MLALETPVATPAGWTALGDLVVGDEVFNRQGWPCRVAWVSQVWGSRPCYDVRTVDGEVVTAGAGHVWRAQARAGAPEKLFSTVELIQPARRRRRIRSASEGLHLPAIALPMDPYVLGVWLGDGDTGAVQIKRADIRIAERIRAAGYPCRPGRAPRLWSLAGENAKPGTPSRVRLELLRCGVLNEKHVPASYLRASRRQRMTLLQALVDVDASVAVDGQVSFQSENRRMAEGVHELARTLGAKATLRPRASGAWVVQFLLAGAASLPERRARCRDSSWVGVRSVWAEPAASVPTRCVVVDSPDRTYLVGRTLLPVSCRS